jgi:hypothetical protein
MSDDPISVPVPEQTDEQKAEQEKQFAPADLIEELLEQLKSAGDNDEVRGGGLREHDAEPRARRRATTTSLTSGRRSRNCGLRPT